MSGTPDLRREFRWALQVARIGGPVPGAARWLAAIVVATLLLLAINIALNFWNRDFYAALEARAAREFGVQLLLFCGLSALFVGATVLQGWSLQSLQLRWRRVLTLPHLDAYAAVSHLPGVDAPDQRVAEDLRLFPALTLQLGVGLFASLASLLWFSQVLWQQAGPMVAGGGVPVPLLLAAAVVAALLGIWAASWAGGPLIHRTARQQALEAELRASLIEARRGTPDIAELRAGLQSALANFARIVSRQRALTFVVSGYGQVGVILPIALAAPAYLGGATDLGGMMQIVSAFEQVALALAFLVRAYGDIVEWRATVRRLGPLADAVPVPVRGSGELTATAPGT